MRGLSVESTHEGIDVNQYLSMLRDSLVRYCLRQGASLQDAEDAAQDTLLKTINLLTGRNIHSNVPALVRTVAKNTLIDYARKRRRLVPFPTMDEAFGSGMDMDALPEVELAIRRLLQLSPLQQVAILFCDVYRFTAREVASILNMTPGAVKAALHRARVQLQRYGMRDGVGDGKASEHDEDFVKAYTAAFVAADLGTLLMMALEGTVDPVEAVSRLTIASQRSSRLLDAVYQRPTKAMAA